MRKIFTLIFFIFVGVLIFTPPPFGEASIFAQDPSAGGKLEINFFYSTTCPYCVAEQKFLDGLAEKYPEVKINRYLITDQAHQQLLKDSLKKHDAEEYLGFVPLTFVGEDFIPGFDNAQGVGKKIEESIQQQLKNIKPPTPSDRNKINLPIIGEIDISKYSLPALAIILGTLDGFNICSLGALALILGLILALRSRKKILIFGGIFILTTAIIYGLLIVLWHQLFSLLASYEKFMQILIGILGIGGGIYFFKEFIKFKKYGPTCDTRTKNNIVSKFSSKIKELLGIEKPELSKGVLAAVIGILIFAAIITIVEFPCSAAIPVIFAGVLAKAHLPAILYLFYIVIYLILYMLDEILVFLVALFTLKLWLASPKFVTWITFAESIILFLLGLYYLIRI